MSRRLACFVVCQPGLEPIVAAELSRLGVDGRPILGGVVAGMTWPQLALVHLHVRTATRVLVRVGRFDATTFPELTRGLRRIDWAACLPPDASLDLRVTATASRLFHTGAIEDRVREVVPFGRGDEQRVVVRIDHDHVIVSLDASGLPLHQRGWRTEAVGAPLRETLAAALVQWTGWDGRVPLVDPCCGSGTIAIEAAMLARRLAPGRHRSFAWQHWPGAGVVDWDKLVAAAAADERPARAPVVAADADAEAVGITTRNAERAGVDLVVAHADVAHLTPPDRPGWVVTNPPYGHRMATDLRALYGAIGRFAAPPWHLAVVSAAGTPTSAFGREWDATLPTRSGGTPVRFLRA